MGDREIQRRAHYLVRQSVDGTGAVCTCGWPAETGRSDHAQDCDLEVAWDDALAQAEDEAEEAKLGSLIAVLEADYRKRQRDDSDGAS